MGVKAPTLFFSKKSSIRRTLLFAGLGLLGLVLTVSILAGSLYTRQQIKKNAAEVQAEVASRVAYEIGQFMDRKLERLVDLAASSSLFEAGSREQALLALLFLKNDSAFTEAAFLSREGKEVLKVSERRLYLPADYADRRRREEFLTALKGENFIGRVYTSDKAEPYVVLAVPIKASPKAVKGVIVAELNLKFLWQVVGEIRFGDAGYAYLVDDRGNLIAYRDPLEVLKGRRLSSLPPVSRFLRNPTSPDPRPAEQVGGLEEQLVLSTFAPVKKVGWAVVVEEPVSSALVDLGRLARYSILLLVLGLIVGAAIILWVSEKITRPIVELHKGAEIIGRGALDHRVKVETGDEIEELAEKFNQMAADLKTSYSTLEQKVEQRTRELRTLYTVSATVNRSLELKVVLREVIQKITEIFDFDATRIFLLDPQTRNLHLDASLEIDDHAPANAGVGK
jgi:HAMP domain-containing protein